MSARKRKEGESFEAYRASLRAEDKLSKLVKRHGKQAVLRAMVRRK